MATILIVEDEAALREGLADKLRLEGFAVETATDGEGGLARARAGGIDLIVLDLMLPRLDGREVCRRLRGAGDRTPIVMLTARAEEVDRVVGLELGADDYVTKPFGTRELIARIRAHLRRAGYAEEDRAGGPAGQDAAAERARFGEVEVDFEGCVVTRAGAEVRLRPLELKVLRLLWARRGRVVTRNQFLDEVWGYERYPTTRTVDFHILQLRKKLERDPNAPEHIVTVHGLGYRLEA